ncbi:MAG TPA: zinc ABC transporter substrate-binding protein [Kiloniellaceae bacterium]|nr:zinc ABC transporter substrate-binding protein [Kiloniellaceae bacterium]
MRTLPIMRIPASSAAFAALFSAALPAAAAEAPVVVTSIAPVHSLVAGIMQGVGEPHLIVKGGGSPHSYSLRPSDAAALEKAAVVFWVGDELEVFLEGPMKSLAGDTKVLSLAEAPNVALLPFREGGPWAEHDDHGDHDAHGHEDHAHEEHAHNGHGHEEHAEAKHAHEDHAHGEHGHEEHGHEEHGNEAHADHAHGHAHDHAHEAEGHEGHAHGETDMHIWLDPHNAQAMAAAIAEALIEADPDNSGVYRANREILVRRLDQLDREMTSELASVKDKPFIVFHDAYQYMEQHFGLSAVGSITVSPERQPGAQRLTEMREKITELGAVCIFAEPQFEPRLVGVVAEGTQAKTGTLDPLGADLEYGPEMYFSLMRGNAEALRNCLSESS